LVITVVTGEESIFAHFSSTVQTRLRNAQQIWIIRSINYGRIDMSTPHVAPIEYDFGGSRARIRVSGAQTSDAFCVVEIETPAGRATPMHHHENEEETLVMLEGELHTIVEDQPQTLRAGSSITLSRGERHQLINLSIRPARYLAVCAPAGFDRFVQACADPQPAPVQLQNPTDAVVERMCAAAKDFRITIYPPVRQD
jgi:quercetin dioxygenase-like cupin family protein